MLLTRRQKNKAYSDPKSYDPGQQVSYILRNIHNIIEICGGNTHVKDFMFGKVVFKMHRFIFKIQIVGGNLADFDDDQHTGNVFFLPHY